MNPIWHCGYPTYGLIASLVSGAGLSFSEGAIAQGATKEVRAALGVCPRNTAPNQTVGFLCPSHPLDLDTELAGSVNRPAPRLFCLIKLTCVPSLLKL